VLQKNEKKPEKVFHFARNKDKMSVRSNTQKEGEKMALVKKNSKTKNIRKVTFSVPAESAGGAKEVRVVGDFNAWNIADDACKLTKKKDGSWSLTLDLETGREYQFRYLLDGTRWENDWAADKYVPAPNTIEDNSVVVL
jgi:1,4-alpha-glucan branching enzyme